MGLITQSSLCISQNAFGEQGGMMYTFRFESCSLVSLLHPLCLLPLNDNARHGADGQC